MNKEKNEVIDYLYGLLTDKQIEEIEDKAKTTIDNIELEVDETHNKYEQYEDFDGKIPINIIVKDEKGKRKKIGTIYYYIEFKGFTFDDLVEESHVEKINFEK